MTLGQKLRFYRTAEGYSQEMVAHLLSIERSTYTYYENEKTLPGVYSVYLLAKIYGITMEVLVDERIVPVGGREFVAMEVKRRRRRRRKGI